MQPYPGSLLDIKGISVGHFTDSRRPTGCTAVLVPEGAVASVDVRGAAPGTRETDLLHPSNFVDKIHGIMLSGGSAFGLSTATGAMRWLEEHGHGLDVRHAIVPIVPAAVIFDLFDERAHVRPDEAAGYSACCAASSENITQGSVGAGAGARCGKLFGFDRSSKGGVGTASVTVHGVTVAALAVCNALGDVYHPDTGEILAGALREDKSGFINTRDAILAGDKPRPIITPTNTTLAVVATDAVLTKPQAHRFAIAAHSGFARCINPVHTQTDGDVVFSLATGSSGQTLDSVTLGIVAAEATTRALINAVLFARSQ